MTTAVDTIKNMDYHAYSLFDRGDIAHSAKTYCKLISIIESTSPMFSSIEKANYYNNCGLSLKRGGQLLPAREMYLKANELTRYHDETYLNNLAACLFELGEYGLAESYYRKAIEIAIRKNNAFDVAFFRSNLGTLMMYWGTLSQAQELLLDSCQSLSTLGARSNFAHALYRLACSLYWKAYWKEAHKMADEAFREKAIHRSADDPRSAEVRLLSAAILLAMNETSNAQDQVRSALSALKSRVFETSPLLGRCHLLLAQCGCRRSVPHKTVNAYLKNAYYCFQKTYDNTDNPDFAEYYFRRAEALMGQGLHRKAMFYLHKSLAIRQRIFVSEHPAFAEHYHRMGCCYERLGEYRDAKRMYLVSLRAYRAIHPYHPHLKDLIGDMAKVYTDGRIADICARYSYAVEANPPDLVRETKPPEPTKPIPQEPPCAPMERIPHIQIVLTATSDQQALAAHLVGRIQSMAAYHAQGRQIDLNVFVQDHPESSSASFDRFLTTDISDYTSRLFVCLAGNHYSNPAVLSRSVLAAQPWITHYRDRAEWELLARHQFTGCTGGVIFHANCPVSKCDLQNPLWKLRSFIGEFQRLSRPLQQVEVKQVKTLGLQNADYMMLRINAAFLAVIRSVQINNSVFH